MQEEAKLRIVRNKEQEQTSYEKKYQVLLFDVDGTLLDFDKAEKIGIERLLTHFGVPATEENMQKYHHLNKKLLAEVGARGTYERAGVKPAI